MTSSPWHGWVLASGFVFDEALTGREALLRRLLATWADEARLAHEGTRWYLVGLPPRRVDSRACLGAPLVSFEGRWLAGPLAAEVSRRAPVDAVLEYRGGELRVTGFDALRPAHPSELLELEVPEVLEPAVLEAPPARVTTSAPPPTMERLFASMLEAHGVHRAQAPRRRASLGERVGEALQRLGRRVAQAVGRVPGPTRPLPDRAPRRRGASPLARAVGWLTARLRLTEGASSRPGFGWLAAVFGSLASSRRAPPPPRDPPAPARAPRPGWLRLAVASLLGRRGARAQARYLEDLRRRFSQGDLGEALRRAIPLASGPGGEAATGLVPDQRSSLSLFAPRSTAAPSMVMDPGEFSEMTKLYREAAATLIARGQIEEAAYVHAKLLHGADAAVAMLEKHGKVELAAQLATAEHLPELTRIRLWLLAGRKDEAVRVARASHDFAALVGALSTRSPELAQRLRVEWGSYLAERHRYAEAISVTVSLPECPEGWEGWVDRALDAGGASAVTALAVDVFRYPEHAPQTRERLASLLEEDRQTTLTAAAAQALLTLAPQAPGVIYRDLWRRLARGAGRGDQVDQKLAERVLKSSGDGALLADAVPARAACPHPAAEPWEVPLPVVPALPALDVAPLPKGRRAVAHGAAGLRIVSAAGETMRHLLVKADVLVAGPVGTPVLVVSRDGVLTRTWKLDPFSFELSSWFQAELGAVSRRYDGLCWAVAAEGALVLLDPGAAGAMEWWRVPGLECHRLDASGGHVIALATDQTDRASWCFVFSADAQRSDRRLASPSSAYMRGKQVVSWELTPREGGGASLRLNHWSGPTVLPEGAWECFPMGAALVLVRLSQGTSELWVADWSCPPARLLVRLPRTVEVRCRDVAPDLLAVCDEHGRVLEVGVRSGQP